MTGDMDYKGTPILTIPPIAAVSHPSSRPVSRPIIVDQSCVMFHDFLDGSSDIKILDQSGRDNNATITGATPKPDGLSFDGLDDKYTVPFSASMDILAGNLPFTYCFAFKFDKVPSVKVEGARLMQQFSGGGAGRVFLQVLDPGDGIQARLQNVVLGAITVAVPDVWFLVTVTFSGGVGGTATIYVDGTAEATATWTPDEGADGDYVFGAMTTGGARHFEGIFNFVAIFNKELSAEEIGLMDDFLRSRI